MFRDFGLQISRLAARWRAFFRGAASVRQPSAISVARRARECPCAPKTPREYMRERKRLKVKLHHTGNKRSLSLSLASRVNKFHEKKKKKEKVPSISRESRSKRSEIVGTFSFSFAFLVVSIDEARTTVTFKRSRAVVGSRRWKFQRFAKRL